MQQIHELVAAHHGAMAVLIIGAAFIAFGALGIGLARIATDNLVERCNKGDDDEMSK